MAKFPTQTEREALQNFKADFIASETAKAEQDLKVKGWRDTLNGELYGNETIGKSQIVSRDVKRQSAWLHPSLLEPFVSARFSVDCVPMSFEDEPLCEQTEKVLNIQFCNQFHRYNFMSKALKVLDSDGTVIVRTFWEITTKKEMQEQPDMSIDEFGEEVQIGIKEVEVEVLVTNRPSAKVCRNEDVFRDPTCQDDTDNCQFTIYRYETDMSTLKKSGNYKNLDKLDGATSDASYFPEDKSLFRFTDKARAKLTVYEYWGNYDLDGDGIAEPIVCCWVQDTIIQLKPNPYPDKKQPFLIVADNSIPFQMYGESNTAISTDTQMFKTALSRGIIDNFASANNGQKGFPNGFVDTTNEDKLMKGKNYFYNSDGVGSGIIEHNYNAVSNSVFTMISMLDANLEALSGVKSFSSGINSASLGGSGSALATQGALDSSATRLLDKVRNVSENLLIPLFRKWVSYNSKFLEPDQVTRMTNREYVEYKTDDVEGDLDIRIEVSTLEDNAMKSRELNMSIQSGGQADSPEVRQMLRAKTLDLQGLVDVAEAVRTYKPEPNPQEEKMAELTMAKLEVEIALEQAKVKEINANSELTMAKIETEISKAKVNSTKAGLDEVTTMEKTNRTLHKEATELKNIDNDNKIVSELTKESQF